MLPVIQVFLSHKVLHPYLVLLSAELLGGVNLTWSWVLTVSHRLLGLWRDQNQENFLIYFDNWDITPNILSWSKACEETVAGKARYWYWFVPLALQSIPKPGHKRTDSTHSSNESEYTFSSEITEAEDLPLRMEVMLTIPHNFSLIRDWTHSFLFFLS